MKDFKKKTIKLHNKPSPGKIEMQTKKNIRNKRDLSLAYSPGVGIISKLISKNKNLVYKYTLKNNLVGVITNGTAVLGLGNIGTLASKPVMEGKCILFKKFANIDSFDIEINETNVSMICKTIHLISDTFGGINLEDIKAPECFKIEKFCKKKLKIPVFHDDQHGTAVVVCSALLNALKIAKKKINKIKTVVIGAGAAALACIKLLIKLGLNKKKLKLFDIEGILHIRRKNINKYQKKFCVKKKINITQALQNADFLLGLSSGNIIKKKMIKKMKNKPIIFALANPDPEIKPKEIKKVKKKAIIATGRSDYPNQVNNVLCFPYIFRAALDGKFKKINTRMKISAVKCISRLGQKDKKFGKKKLLPSPFDKRLIKYIPLKIIIDAKKKNNKKFKKINIKKYKKYLKSISDKK